MEEDGDYRLCFDNTASRWSDKTVWFEIQVEDPEDDYDTDDDKDKKEDSAEDKAEKEAAVRFRAN